MHLQIIFVGQPKFEEKLNSQRLRQINERLKIKLQINALNREESKDYIEHRLKLVGSSISKIFTPEAISMICSYSKGIPRIINILCSNALRRGYRLSRKRIDPDIIREVIKNLEGPMPRKGLLSPVTTSLKGICPFTPGLTLPFKKLSIAILLLLCVIGLVLVTYEYRQQRSTKTWRGKISLQSPHHVPLATASSSSALEEETIEKIVVVKEGQTISSMAEQFYRTINPTLIAFILDFNPQVTNADFITVGQKIKVPKLTEESLIKIADHAYKIHVGTFVTPDFAGLYRNEPALKGKEIEILPRKVSPKDTWYRIVIGKFSDKNEALKITDLLKEKGLLPFFGDAPKK
jgi:general secretion pathway protein A